MLATRPLSDVTRLNDSWGESDDALASFEGPPLISPQTVSDDSWGDSDDALACFEDPSLASPQALLSDGWGDSDDALGRFVGLPLASSQAISDGGWGDSDDALACFEAPPLVSSQAILNHDQADSNNAFGDVDLLSPQYLTNNNEGESSHHALQPQPLADNLIAADGHDHLVQQGKALLTQPNGHHWFNSDEEASGAESISDVSSATSHHSSGPSHSKYNESKDEDLPSLALSGEKQNIVVTNPSSENELFVGM